MRNSIFEFLMVKNAKLVMKSGSEGQLSYEKWKETAFFTMTERKFRICNGKKEFEDATTTFPGAKPKNRATAICDGPM